MTRTDCCHGCGKAVAINRFGQHASPRNLLMDTLDGVGVSISGDEDDGPAGVDADMPPLAPPIPLDPVPL